MESMNFNFVGSQAVVRGLTIKLGIGFEVAIIKPFTKVSSGFPGGGAPERLGMGCNA